MRIGVAAAVVDGELVPGDVDVQDGRVVAVGVSPAGAGVAVPGLVDLQVNGYRGVDVLSAGPDDLVTMGEALLRDGVFAYQPTLVTCPHETVLGTLAAIGGAAGGRGATILGAHLEGPFLSPQRPGAHPPEHLRAPDLDLLTAYLDAGAAVSTVTLAPELPGALRLVSELVERGVCVSLGHTDATAEEAHAAFDLGAPTVTHLFNAMRPLRHRDPGVAGAALAREDVVVQVIADGVHVAPEALLTAWRAARGRFVLVSDAIAAAGCDDGRFVIGAIDVTVQDGVSRTADGRLAGSVQPLVVGLRLLVELGVPLVEAVDAVTRAPARVLGRDDVGQLRVGGRADLVVLAEDNSVERVLLGGDVVV